MGLVISYESGSLVAYDRAVALRDIGQRVRAMRDLDKALTDILLIRNQIAAGTAFRGYGPSAVALTAVFAAVTLMLQQLFLDDATLQPLTFFAGWVLTAVLSLLVTGSEMIARARRHHSGLADTMILQAVEQFLPAAVAGVLLAAILLKFAPGELWLLPGLWQLLVGLGIFASLRSLPRLVAIAGTWYFVAGFAVLILVSQSHALSPWTMGVPFVVGQLVMAAILYVASDENNDEE